MNYTKKSPTKDELANALLSMLKEKSFINITVTELVKKAGVARASFYRNFGSTSDVMNYLIDSFIQRMFVMIRPVIESPDNRTWRDFLFEYIYFLRSSENHYFQIQSDNMALLFTNFITKIRDIKLSYPTENYSELRVLSAKLALANGVLIDWKETGARESTEEIVDFIMNCISRF